MAEQASKNESTVKVKFLRQAGRYQPGDEAEVSAEQAERLCAPSPQNEAGTIVNRQKAIRVSDLGKLSELNIDPKYLTQAEMDAQGRKNQIPSPYDSHPQALAKETGETASEIIKENEPNVDSAGLTADTQEGHGVSQTGNERPQVSPPAPSTPPPAAPSPAAPKPNEPKSKGKSKS